MKNLSLCISSMLKTLPSFFIAATMAMPVFADENEFPAETTRSYEGTSFEVNVPCVEQTVQDFLGRNLVDFNSEIGLIFGRNDNSSVLVNLLGERAESDQATVSWFQISTNSAQASINHDGLGGSFIQAIGAKKHQSMALYNIQDFELMLRNCGLVAALS